MAPERSSGPDRTHIGVFGGTFDPPHVGHVAVATDVADALDLDEVLWMVAARSPLKPDTVPTDPEDRLAMVRAATTGDARFRVREDEVRRGGVSYTVDTLRGLSSERPADAFFLILGADQYRVLDEWKDVAELRRLARLTVVERRGTPSVGLPDEDVLLVSTDAPDVSSSAIRSAVSEGRSCRSLVPPAVWDLIVERGLYRSRHP